MWVIALHWAGACCCEVGSRVLSVLQVPVNLLLFMLQVPVSLLVERYSGGCKDPNTELSASAEMDMAARM